MAYRGGNVDEMLMKNAKRYVNAKGIVSVKNDTVQLTPVFLWYHQAVFGGDDAQLTEHLKTHAYPNLKSALYRGRTFKSKSLNYRLDNYEVPKPEGVSDRSRRTSGGYGS